jgi:hypothetical protein
MIKKKPSFFLAAFLFLFLLSWVGVSYCSFEQDVVQAQTSTHQEKEEPEKIVGAPQDAKQKTGILVFVAWMWISVFVIIYFLRLKIKEADRLHRLRFYSAKKS